MHQSTEDVTKEDVLTLLKKSSALAAILTGDVFSWTFPENMKCLDVFREMIAAKQIAIPGDDSEDLKRILATGKWDSRPDRVFTVIILQGFSRDYYRDRLRKHLVKVKRVQNYQLLRHP